MLDVEPEGSKGKKLPRIEYFGRTVPTDASGRRAWPAELAQRLAEESFISTLPVERFAEEWDLNPSTLSKWRMALLRTGFDPKRGLRDRRLPASAPMFAKAVMIEPEAELQPARVAPPALIVEHAGTTVRLPVGADAELLRLVIFSLRSA